MGEVYRARDPRLGREVAVKVLPDSFSADENRLRRFQQEARTAGMLNHPNVLAIYDVGTHEGSPYLVSELLEGETLRARLGAGPLPRSKVFELGSQIAMGLAAAHEKGIIHRDLKPENLFLTRDGRAKILDFGLAKLIRPDTVERTDAPTLARDTDPGVVMGTVGYLSPEQVRGQEADARSDIFALGAVVYEMLTGRRAFQRPTAIETLNAILSEDPPEPTDASLGITRLLKRCLEKRPEERFQSARDLGFALEALSEPSGPAGTQPPSRGPKVRDYAAWVLAGVLAIAFVALGIAHVREPEPESREYRFSVLPPEGAFLGTPGEAAGFALSPDGRQLVFAATQGGVRQLFLRALDSLEARPLAGTAGASHPFWSPDSRFVGFFASGKLKRMDTVGGPPQTLCDAAEDRGGTWSKDGVILFAPEFNGPLHRVSAAGGSAAPFTKLDPSRQEYLHRWPEFLPDGRHFLYLARSSSPEHTGIYVRSLDSEESRRLVSGTYSSAGYLEPYLLFARGETLMAQPFDASRLELSGEPFPVLENVAAFIGKPHFSVSQTQVLAFRSPDFRHTVPIWFDREGKEIRALGSLGIGPEFTLSPDERWLAGGRVREEMDGPDIWLFDLSYGTTARLTSHPAHDILPVWSPDGTRIVFSSNRLAGGGNDLFLKTTSGAEEDELLLRTGATNVASDWSPDGRFIIYQASNPKTNFDIWAAPVEGEGEPIPLVQTEFYEAGAVVSPDGRWLAYSSDESGRHEVYIRRFLGPGGSQPVSTHGGLQPLWRSDGRELFYLSLERNVMSVEVSSTESAIRLGAPRTLFEAPILLGEPYSRTYAISRDGQRFLISTVPPDASSPIQIVLNWMPKERS
jgi:Tol biopolymer transport system component